jgi:hypothetical protein
MNMEMIKEPGTINGSRAAIEFARLVTQTGVWTTMESVFWALTHYV